MISNSSTLQMVNVSDMHYFDKGNVLINGKLMHSMIIFYKYWFKCLVSVLRRLWCI